MIVLVYNDVMTCPEILLDDLGIDQLIRQLQDLKVSRDHTHLRSFGEKPDLQASSPYGHKDIYKELILSLIEIDDQANSTHP